MDQVILVGISSIGNETDWHRQRNRDFTPTAYSVRMMGGTMAPGDIPMNQSTTGFADEFMLYENATHNSVLPQRIYDSIEWMYEKTTL